MNEQTIPAINSSMCVQDITGIILSQYYPTLFSFLTSLHSNIQDLLPEQDISVFLSLQVKMNEELDEIYRREKLVLFPFLKQLEAKQQMSDSCKPFKTVKNHFGNLLAVTNQLLALLQQMPKDNDTRLQYDPITDITLQFKQQIIYVQDIKEQYLFGRFRNCNGGCKTMTS